MTAVRGAEIARSAEKPWAVTAEKIGAVVQRLVAAASPLQLIAYRCAEACGFGSAATGDLAAANDLDLLVVVPELSSRYNEMVHLQKTLHGTLMFVDLVVTSQARYNERRQIPGTVEFTAKHQGRVLHDDLSGT